MKSRENIERITVPVKSSRIAHFSRQVLDLQNVYHSAQKKVSQLTQELQLHTNKPEYKRRCEEIRKELCNKIDDTVRKQKSYERENARLKKMMDRRTFTRIERAFIATTTLVNHLTKAPGLNYQRNYRPKRKYVKCKQC
jgi:cell shape-determining protein MreC